ncbi:helix-turn-helix transcriptional regulator [Bacillus subtilis]|nr:helix-turn-helix transcriptional regulator [Bacillus subtilis]
MEAAAISKKIRAMSGITKKELAQLADVSPSTITRIERGEMDPTWGTMQKIFSATGYQLNGTSVVSSGDTSAIQAANIYLEPLLRQALAPMAETFRATAASSGNALTGAARTAIGSAAGKASTAATAVVAEAVREPMRAASAPAVQELLSNVKIPTGEWADRWKRTGWLKDSAGVDDLVAIAVIAGNAGKVARRRGARVPVEIPKGWRDLVDRLAEAGVDYAVSGIVATGEDRSDAQAGAPLIYVSDPRGVVEQLGLERARPGRGVLLLEAMSGELDDVESEGGIRFVPRSRALLDAFSGPGRDPDKAEDLLRTIWQDAS